MLFFLEVYLPLKPHYYNTKLDLGFSKESKVISCPIPPRLPRELDPKCLWLFWKTSSITEIHRVAHQKLHKSKVWVHSFENDFCSTSQGPSVNAALGIMGTTSTFPTGKSHFTHRNRGKKCSGTFQSFGTLKIKGKAPLSKSTGPTQGFLLFFNVLGLFFFSSSRFKAEGVQLFWLGRMD